MRSGPRSDRKVAVVTNEGLISVSYDVLLMKDYIPFM